MKHPETYKVTQNDLYRGTQQCCWCHATLGQDHEVQCVRRKRTVMIQVTLEVLVEVPEHWTEENINFYYGESSWCGSNIIPELKKYEKDNRCICDRYKGVDYVREATVKDEKRAGIV
jgi:hypothetical protein